METTVKSPKIEKLESAVKRVRQLVREGRENEAWPIMERMVATISGAIAKRVYGAQYNRSNREDAIQEIHLRLYTEWLSLAKEHEFWEVAFGWDLKTTITNVMQKYNNTVKWQKEYQYKSPLASEEGHIEEWHENVADSNYNDYEDTDNRLAIRYALSQLTPTERDVFLLFHAADTPQAEIAAKYKVTTRTIRNWIDTADKKIHQALAA